MQDLWLHRAACIGAALPSTAARCGTARCLQFTMLAHPAAMTTGLNLLASCAAAHPAASAKSVSRTQPLRRMLSTQGSMRSMSACDGECQSIQSIRLLLGSARNGAGLLSSGQMLPQHTTERQRNAGSVTRTPEQLCVTIGPAHRPVVTRQSVQGTTMGAVHRA